MGQVAVTMNGRTYRLRCGDGEEARLLALANHVKGKVEQLTSEFGQVGEDRLLLMASLLVADELFDARERLSGQSGVANAAPPPVAAAPAKVAPPRAASPAPPDPPAAAGSGPRKAGAG